MELEKSVASKNYRGSCISAVTSAYSYVRVHWHRTSLLSVTRSEIALLCLFKYFIVLRGEFYAPFQGVLHTENRLCDKNPTSWLFSVNTHDTSERDVLPTIFEYYECWSRETSGHAVAEPGQTGGVMVREHGAIAILTGSWRAPYLPRRLASVK